MIFSKNFGPAPAPPFPLRLSGRVIPEKQRKKGRRMNAGAYQGAYERAYHVAYQLAYGL